MHYGKVTVKSSPPMGETQIETQEKKHAERLAALLQLESDILLTKYNDLASQIGSIWQLIRAPHNMIPAELIVWLVHQPHQYTVQALLTNRVRTMIGQCKFEVLTRPHLWHEDPHPVSHPIIHYLSRFVILLLD